MKIKNTKISKNHKRKVDYAAQASEGLVGKEARNREIEAGLAAGAENIILKGKKIKVEEIDPKTGKKTKVFYRASEVLTRPKMPTATVGGRSAKRAKMKAARTKKVGHFDHPDGSCPNIGCARCNPAFNMRKAANRA